MSTYDGRERYLARICAVERLLKREKDRVQAGGEPMVGLAVGLRALVRHHLDYAVERNRRL